MNSAILRVLVVLVVIFCIHSAPAKKKETEECDNPDVVTIVTEEELSTKTGKDGGDIWLSVMGEVYDVSNGRAFYSEGSSYAIFAGRDASVPFITGAFTAEEAKKSLLDESIKPAQLVSLEEWRKFYETNDQYPFVGLLAGRHYDKDGKPTEEMEKVREIITNFVPPAKKKS